MNVANSVIDYSERRVITCFYYVFHTNHFKYKSSIFVKKTGRKNNIF